MILLSPKNYFVKTTCNEIYYWFTRFHVNSALTLDWFNCQLFANDQSSVQSEYETNLNFSMFEVVSHKSLYNLPPNSSLGWNFFDMSHIESTSQSILVFFSSQTYSIPKQAGTAFDFYREIYFSRFFVVFWCRQAWFD